MGAAVTSEEDGGRTEPGPWGPGDSLTGHSVTFLSLRLPYSKKGSQGHFIHTGGMSFNLRPRFWKSRSQGSIPTPVSLPRPASLEEDKSGRGAESLPKSASLTSPRAYWTQGLSKEKLQPHPPHHSVPVGPIVVALGVLS